MSVLAPGTLIGDDFEIVGLIGEGGMGSVYEARQRSTGAARAVKMMRADIARGEQFRRRFDQEARVSARIASEHVVEVIAAGVDEASGMPWLAMELLRGDDLGRAVARRGPLDRAQAAEVFRQLGHGLSAAHRAGIVHRDLKPENVFLAESRRATESLVVKILDFGIAKVVSGAHATATGAMGTPMWMAPEQAARDAPISPATDVWALGLVAFFALTGRPFWNAANDAGGTPLQLLREITSDPIASASERARQLGVEVPAGFDAWFAQCVMREATARFADAGQATAPLLALLGESPGDPLAPSLAIAASRAAAPLPYARTESLEPPSKTAGAFASTEPRPAVRAEALSPTRNRWRRVGTALAGLGLASAAAVGWMRVRELRAPAAAVAATAASTSAGPASEPSTRPPAGLGIAIDRARAVPMVEVPGAVFVIGSSDGAADERPPLRQSVAAFAMDVTEVTTASYFVCVDDGKCTPPASGARCTGRAAPDQPISCVTYAQADGYCAWAGKRLPSETEWELAARGGGSGAYPWGAAPPRDQLCWLATSDGGPCDVGRFAAGNTPRGLEDMAGNVWEWTSGHYCPYDHPSCGDPRRVLRGGAWSSQDPKLVTVSVRMESFESNEGASIGFRCARSL